MTDLTYEFTAAKARDASDATKSITGLYLQKETKDILCIIESAAQSGLNAKWFSRNEKVIVQRLEFLGYTVEVHNNQRDGALMKVSW